VRKTIEQRVLTLEEQMGELRGMPTQISDLRSQVSQLSDDMRAEFSAIRGETATQADMLRGEMAAQADMLRGEMAAQADTLRGEMAAQADMLRGETGTIRQDMAVFRADFIARDDETRRHARMMHEDVIARLALTREGGPRSPRPRKRR
jgi:outer membrane murein-binding lipoprotein Lpp